MNLSKHVTVNEFCFSPTAIRAGIKNVMALQQLENATLLCEKVFEPLRAHVGKPIKINSGFRSPSLNRAIGSSSSSQHCKGQAMDLELHDKELFDWIIDNLEYDQLIFEFGTEQQAAWFHISYSHKNNRKEVLRATKKAGKTVYSKYIR
jgi:hypothetical protein